MFPLHIQVKARDSQCIESDERLLKKMKIKKQFVSGHEMVRVWSGSTVREMFLLESFKYIFILFEIRVGQGIQLSQQNFWKV